MKKLFQLYLIVSARFEWDNTDMKVKGFKDTIDWYNANAAAYANASEQGFSLNRIEEFVSLVKPLGKVLDAGCGAGRDTHLLSEKGLHVIGLDLSSGLLEEARKRYPNLEFKEGNFLHLPFKESTFDGIWSNASLLHLETVEEVKTALSEFHRVTKKDGVLHVSVKAQKGEKKTAIVSDKLSNHNRFFQYFRIEELENLLVDCKFKIIKIGQYKEIDENPNGRPEVEWIVALGRV